MMSRTPNGVELANSPEQIEFNLNEIPKHQVEALCLAVSDLVKRVKENLKADPKLYAEFLAWKANREKQRKEGKIPATQ